MGNKPRLVIEKVKSKITLIKWTEPANRKNSNVYMVNSTFSILYLFFKAYVKITLSYILDGLHAISSGAFYRRLDSPGSYAAFILLRAICCLNSGASTSKIKFNFSESSSNGSCKYTHGGCVAHFLNCRVSRSID